MDARPPWEMALAGNNWKLLWLTEPAAKRWLEKGLTQSGRAMEGILQMARIHRFPLLLVVYPYPVMMAHGRMDNEHTQFWKKFAAENGVSLLDLSPRFVEVGLSPQATYAKYFIPGDFHWNNGGNRLVASELTPLIREKIESAKPSLSPK